MLHHEKSNKYLELQDKSTLALYRVYLIGARRLVILSLLFFLHVELEQERAQLRMVYIIAAGVPLRKFLKLVLYSRRCVLVLAIPIIGGSSVRR